MDAADAFCDIFKEEEKKLNDMCTIVLAAAVSEFGDDSDEYEQLGGTRKSDRKKPVRKPKA